jgi:hypothetical protein
MIAVLFRTEGLAFLAFTPLILLFKPDSSLRARCCLLLRAYSISLAAAAILVGALLAGLIESKTAPVQVQIILVYISQIYAQISEGLAAKAQIFGDQVLGRFLDDYALHGLVLTLSAVIFGKITGTASWLSFLLVAFQYRIKNLQMSRDAKAVLCWSGIIAIGNMLVTLLANFLLAGRYVVPFALIVIVFAAFSLAAVYRNSSRAVAGDSATGPRWLLPLIAFTLCVYGFMIFKPKPEGYTYEKEAVAWVRDYAKADTEIFYDNARLRYYAGLPLGERGISYWEVVDMAIKDGSLLQHDFLVVHIERNKPEQERYLTQLGYRPIREFTARNKTKVVIFARDPGTRR